MLEHGVVIPRAIHAVPKGIPPGIIQEDHGDRRALTPSSRRFSL
jgi:hypothetical protein